MAGDGGAGAELPRAVHVLVRGLARAGQALEHEDLALGLDRGARRQAGRGRRRGRRRGRLRRGDRRLLGAAAAAGLAGAELGLGLVALRAGQPAGRGDAAPPAGLHAGLLRGRRGRDGHRGLGADPAEGQEQHEQERQAGHQHRRDPGPLGHGLARIAAEPLLVVVVLHEGVDRRGDLRPGRRATGNAVVAVEAGVGLELLDQEGREAALGDDPTDDRVEVRVGPGVSLEAEELVRVGLDVGHGRGAGHLLGPVAEDAPEAVVRQVPVDDVRRLARDLGAGGVWELDVDHVRELALHGRADLRVRRRRPDLALGALRTLRPGVALRTLRADRTGVALGTAHGVLEGLVLLELVHGQGDPAPDLDGDQIRVDLVLHLLHPRTDDGGVHALDHHRGGGTVGALLAAVALRTLRPGLALLAAAALRTLRALVPLRTLRPVVALLALLALRPGLAGVALQAGEEVRVALQADGGLGDEHAARRVAGHDAGRDLRGVGVVALLALRTGLAGVALLALRTGLAGVALGSLVPLDEGEEPLVVDEGPGDQGEEQTSRHVAGHDAGRDLRGVGVVALLALRADLALRAGLALRTLRAGLAGVALDPLDEVVLDDQETHERAGERLVLHEPARHDRLERLAPLEVLDDLVEGDLLAVLAVHALEPGHERHVGLEEGDDLGHESGAPDDHLGHPPLGRTQAFGVHRVLLQVLGDEAPELGHVEHGDRGLDGRVLLEHGEHEGRRPLGGTTRSVEERFGFDHPRVLCTIHRILHSAGFPTRIGSV